MPRNTDEVGPRLPINNRATGSPRKKGGGRGRAGLASQARAWADFTPTPWLDHTPTPWNTLGSEFGTGPFGMPQHHHSMGQPTPHHDSATADDALEHSSYWAPTPTPSGCHHMMYGFGVGMPPTMPGLPLQPPPVFAAAAMAAAAGAAGAAAAVAAAGVAGAEATSPHADVLRTGAERVVDDEGAAVPVITAEEDLPSRGSDLHAAGKCRPCAWFWKEQGCQNAEACGYCHLCPQGELRNRKKSKVAAMRAGALGSAKAGNTAGATRTLKLTPLV